VGHGCFFNEGVGLCATTQIEIDAHGLIGDRVTIIDSTFHDAVRENKKWRRWRSVRTILPAVRIRDVIAAGSIVAKSAPARSVAAGVRR
jgi:acetyltransferase-like isoleucine patch superfamily enzyme